MAVYRYRLVLSNREDQVESGTVVAHDEDEAKRKLQRLFDFGTVRLARVGGLMGFLKSLTADIK